MKEAKEKKTGKYKYLVNNIALFSVSNFVSKILVFLLVPLYTGVLTTEQYGVADIIQVTILLLVPALTVNMGEAALRFGIEKSDMRGSILHIGLKYVARADTIAIVGAFIAMIFANAQIKWYIALFVFLFIANSLYEYLVLFFQGSEMVPIVVIGSVSSTLIMIVSNIVFLLVIKTGLNGYIFSQVIAYGFAAVLMLILGKVMRADLTRENNAALEKEMVTYARPLLMYSTASWVNNAVDRYFVLYLCGAAVNGVYGVAYKIPAILMVFQRIFAQAWQLSATKAHKDTDSTEFFSDMYKIYNSFMVIGCGFLILIVKPLASFLFKKDFYEAWKLVAPLLISVIFGALTGFLGSICLAHKDSKSMGRATGIGALVNVVLNLILIPYFSAMGAAIATGISYFTMCFMALIFVRKHVDIKVTFVKNIISYIILVAQSIVMICELPYHFLICGLLFITLIILYFKDFVSIINVLLSKIKSSN